MAPVDAASTIPFSMAGRNCCGTEPPKILSSKMKPPPRGRGSKTTLQSPTWPGPHASLAPPQRAAPAGLLLVPTLHLGAHRDGLLVRDLRRVERHLDVVA